MTGLHERMAYAGLRQMADWARAWVENETTMPERGPDQLTAEQAAALALIGALLKEKA